MRKTAATAILLAALMATVPAAAGEPAPGTPPGVFAPVAAPNPDPVVVTSIDPGTASEGTASIVSNPAVLTPIVSAQPAPAAGQTDPNVMPFVVPVQIPANMLYQQPQRYPQQAQQLPPQQQQYLQEQQAYQRQQYEERLRQWQEYQAQQQYARQYAEQYAVRQQELAEQQRQIQAQMQQLAAQQQQLSAQAATVRQESLALQQRRPFAGQPYVMPTAGGVRQFDPNTPVPPQPPMRLPYNPAAAQQQPQPQFAAPVPLAPMPAPQYTPPAAQPLPASDVVDTLRNPSTGGEKPVLALITPAGVKQALRQGVQLVMLDVRDQYARNAEGIIPGSVPVPFEPAASFTSRVAQVIPRGGKYPVVVFCSDGTASAKATELLAQDGGYPAYLMGAYRLWVE